MAGICTSNIPGGKSGCEKLLLEAKYALISRPSVVYNDEYAFKSLFNKITNLNTPDANKLMNSYLMEIYPPENTTDDPNVVTFANTQKIVTNKPTPSITMIAKTSFAGSQTLLKDLNGSYKIEFFGADGLLLGTYNPESFEYSGFDCTITATTKGIPTSADPEKMVNLYVNFSVYEQFENSVAVSLEWNAGLELKTNQPNGLTVRPTSKYTFAGGTIDAQVNDSNGIGFEGLVTADAIDLRSNSLTDIAIAVTEDALKGGKYSLAITKDLVPANLDPGDTLVIQFQKKDGGTTVLFISNEIVMNVLS